MRKDARYFSYWASTTAAELGILGDFDPERCAQEMKRAADWLEGLLAKSPHLPIVTRNSGDRRVRAYVFHLATQAREIFGAGMDDVLLEVVTIITNAALDLMGAQKRSQEQVRTLLRGFGFKIAKAGP